MMPSISVWNASGRWSRPEKRTRLRARRSPRVAMTSDVTVVTPTSATARMFAISAVRPCRIPAFTTRRRSSAQHVVGQSSRAMASQSRAAKYAWKRSSTRLAAFSSRGAGRLSSSNLASAASRSASSNISQRLIRSPSTVTNVDLSPLGVEALLRGPMRRVGDDRSEVAQPMHGLDVDADVRRDVPRGTDVCDQVTGRERCRRAGGRCSPSPASSREARAG